MSVTRYIEKNTATQVNSNLIGVQVRPDTGSISMDYVWRTITVFSDDVEYRNIYILTPDDETLPDYAYKAATYNYIMPDPDSYIDVPDGQGGYDRYLKFYIYAAGPQENVYRLINSAGTFLSTDYCTITSETIEEETVYTVTRWGEQKGYFGSPGEPGSTIELYGGEWLLLDNTHIYNIYDDTDQTGFRYDPDNRFVYDDADGLFAVIKDGVVSTAGIRMVADLQDSSDWTGKYEWVGTPEYELEGEWETMSQYWTNVPVYTVDIDPAIGATVYYTKDYPDYNQMTVSGKAPGAVSCSVEYSVTGDTFTQVEDTLTDDNNVIANVPRYVYLRFGQDVEITEE